MFNHRYAKMNFGRAWENYLRLNRDAFAGKRSDKPFMSLEVSSRKPGFK